ncbi:hypothetical protein AB4Z14_21205 [Terrabacter sp. 2TAF16]|uniref:hypothetical protein n=1 Tax=Terrabacter sp. 2TAF16 TaxID=3233008 RepID=UPI003F99625C
MKKATVELEAIVLARESPLMDLHGVHPVVVARVLADVGTRLGSLTATGSRPGPARRRSMPTDDPPCRTA